MADHGGEIRLSDLRVCGGSLEWEEFRQVRRQNMIDGLREVFEPKPEAERRNDETPARR